MAMKKSEIALDMDLRPPTVPSLAICAMVNEAVIMLLRVYSYPTKQYNQVLLCVNPICMVSCESVEIGVIKQLHACMIIKGGENAIRDAHNEERSGCMTTIRKHLDPFLLVMNLREWIMTVAGRC